METFDQTIDESLGSVTSQIPTYLIAADNHAIGNGQESLLERGFNFTASVLTRAVASTINIAPEAGNWVADKFFGAGKQFNTVSTEDILYSMDNDLGAYYTKNRESVDLVGDVAASFVPGMAGVKVLNWGQKGLKLYAQTGKLGSNLASGLGSLADKQAKFAALAAQETSTGGATSLISSINTNLVKSAAYGYAQGALEGAAFEVAAMASMSQSPIFSEHTATDVLTNALYGGGILGAGFVGSITALQTRGLYKAAQKTTELKFAPYSTITQVAPDTEKSHELLFNLRDRNNTPEIPAEFSSAESVKATQLLQTRGEQLDNRATELLMGLTGKDVDASVSLLTQLKAMTYPNQMAAVSWLQEASREGDRTLRLERMSKVISKKLKGNLDIDEVVALQGELDSIGFKSINLATGEIHAGEQEALKFADNYRSQEQIDAAVRGYKFKVSEQWDVVAAQDYRESQARTIWANKLTEAQLPQDHIIGVNDLPLQRRAFDLGYENIHLSDGTVIHRNDFVDYLQTKVKTVAAELQSYSKSGVKNASTETIMARLRNEFGQHIEGMTSEEIDKVFGLKGFLTNGLHQQVQVLGDGVYKFLNRTVINTDKFKGASYTSLIGTLLHEEGHAKTLRYIYANQIPNDPALLEEAVNLSKQRRPGAWKAAKGSAEYQAYLNEPAELLADAYAQLSRNPALRTNGKYENVLKYFGQELRDLSPETVRNAALGKRELSTSEIAHWLDVKDQWLTGESAHYNTRSDLFRSSAEGAYTPEFLRMGYKKVTGADGHELDSMIYAKQQQELWRDEAKNAVDRTIISLTGNDDSISKILPKLDSSSATSADRGAGTFVGANGNYGSVEAISQYIGLQTHNAVSAAREKVATAFMSHEYTFRTDTEASAHLGAILNVVSKQADRYVVDMNGMQLVRKDLVEWEKAKAIAESEGKEFTTLRPAAKMESTPDTIPVANMKVLNFLQDWATHNNTVLEAEEELRRLQGKPPRSYLKDTVYVPPPNPKDYKYYGFVKDPTVFGGNRVQMIWAPDAETLERTATQVRSLSPNYQVYYKQDTKEFKQALGEYHHDLAVTDTFFDGELARSGVAAPFLPVTDGNILMDNMMGWRSTKDSNVVRDAIATHYAIEIKELRQKGREIENVTTSKVGGYGEKKIPNPYEDIVKTMLDLPRSDESGWFGKFNDTLESGFSSVWSKVSESWNKKDYDIGEINQAFRKAGINVGFPDELTATLANTPQQKKYLAEFVNKANSILSTLMLGTDPMNAYTNVIGSSVMLSTELRSLINGIKSGNSSVAGELAELAHVIVPGTGDAVLSPMKLMAKAEGAWVKSLFNNTDPKEFALLGEFKRQGFITSRFDQIQQAVGPTVLKEASVENLTALNKATGLMKDLMAGAEKWSGNKLAEEHNRFIAAHIAHQITDLAVKSGVLASKDKWAYINTFVNRTQGNYLASQRPSMFKGPVGQAIGLFQTYQFNMLQQLTRYIGEGQGKNALFMMGMQGTIFGMNGLPFFQQINNTLIGNAKGNTENRDIYTESYRALGKSSADWLMYGLASNLPIHPDLKVNVYSRGDINPRFGTIVPVNPMDTPIFSATAKLFSSMKETASKVMEGGAVWSSLLQGIEHAGISRPLSGLAVVLEGLDGGKSYSTTERGNVVLSHDMFSLASMARLTGARPLDEAIARDYLSRAHAYDLKRTERRDALGEVIKTHIIAGHEITGEMQDEFAHKYMEIGGKQDGFLKFYAKQFTNATQSQINQMERNNRSPSSAGAQLIMGGYYLEDKSFGAVK